MVTQQELTFEIKRTLLQEHEETQLLHLPSDVWAVVREKGIYPNAPVVPNPPWES